MKICAGVVALACTTPVWALSPTTPVDITLFLAGATAEKNTLPGLLGGHGAFTRYSFAYPAATALCQSGTLDIYYDSKPSPKHGYDYRAYSCTLTTNTALLGNYPELAGKKIMIHYRMKNGSWFGTGPVARNLPVTRMKIDSNCVTTTRPANTGSAPVPVAIPAFPLAGTAPTVYNTPSYVCPTETVNGGVTDINEAQLVTNEVPDVGIADNEPAIFFGANAPYDGNPAGGGNPAQDAAMTGSDVANLTTTPVFAVTLGIAASKKLINAMQTAQGLANTAAGVVVLDADRPNLTSPQIASLLTSNGGPYNTNWSPLVGAGDTHKINICRRISAVATQISANAYWNNYPCAADGIPPSIPGDSTSTYRVIENDLIPDERGCLQGFNNGTSFARGYTPAGAAINESPASATDNYAIGPLFTDNNQSSEGFAWDFTKVDGVDPTVANAVSGKYRYVNTAVINLRNGTAAADTNTNKGKLRDLLFTALARPDILAVQNGFLALPDLGYTPGVDGNNVLKGTTAAKTCAPQSLFF